MTWSAFLVAMRNGSQSRANAVRHGANCVQRTPAPMQTQTKRAASSQASTKNTNIDFLIPE